MTLTSERASRTEKSPRVHSVDAGWSTDDGSRTEGSWRALMEGMPRRKRRSWFNPIMWWKCRNDRLARLSDPVPFERSRWVGEKSGDDLVVDLGLPQKFSFLLMGDTGEGDQSQYAVAPPVGNEGKDTAFLLLCSDVLYPLGDVNDYAWKFYKPYSLYGGPVYGLPGNHDWYDGLAAFMYHLCGVTEPMRHATFRAALGASGQGWFRTGLRWLLWRRAKAVDTDSIGEGPAFRPKPSQRQPIQQPGPYHVIDAGPLRLVCIDTGILGDIDEAQARWLIEVSRDPRPKILLTGKPLLVDGGFDPSKLRGSNGRFADVLEVVHDAPFNYLGSIGGDIHNYQHYPVELNGRTYRHLVSGGGGAFMHATHLIDDISASDIGKKFRVTEGQFRCYPLRLDSLAIYSRVLQDKLAGWGLRLPLALSPDEAAYMAYRKRKVDKDDLPERAANAQGAKAKPPWLRRTVAHGVLNVGGHAFHKWFSPFFDWDTAPFFKNFLRLDVDGTLEGGRVEVTCFGVTGHREDEHDIPVADSFVMTWGAQSSG